MTDDWKCPRCGEMNPATFESCWKCGPQSSDDSDGETPLPGFCQGGNPWENGTAAPMGQSTDNPTPESPDEGTASASLGTAWLKFWNYFCLPAGALLDEWLLLRVPSYAATLVPILILRVALAYGLHVRKLWAWQWNWVLIGVSYIGMLTPISTVGIHDNDATAGIVFMIKAVLGGLIWLWPNVVYWKKRRCLFS